MKMGIRNLLLGCTAAFALAACSSPEQKVAKYYSSGESFLEEQDFARAKIQFRNALKIDEQHIPSLIAMADLAERDREFQDMFALLQAIVRLDPAHLPSLVKLGQLHLLSSDEGTAIEFADKALAIDPEHNDATALKAAIQLRLGDSQSALALAQIVIDRDPGHIEATTVLATERTAAEDYDGALVHIDRALAIDSKTAILQLLKIRLLGLLDRKDDVVASYVQLIEDFPEITAYRKAYTLELIARDDEQGGLEQLRKIAELEPDSLDAKLDVVRIINKMDGLDAGEKQLRAFIDANPENLDLSYALIDYLIERDRTDEAKGFLKTLASTKVEADALRAKNRLSAIYITEGSTDEASVLVEEILAADEGNTDALMRRAAILMQDQKFDEAILELRKALNGEPNSPEILALMANAFENQGNIPLARSEYRKAFNIEGSSARIAHVFASFLVRKNELADAEEVLTQSIAEFPRSRENLTLLASTRLRLQDWQGADEVATILQSLDSEEDNELVRNIRSTSLLGLQDFDGVIDVLASGHEEKPLSSQPLALLTAAYLRTGKIDEANALVDGVIASDPSDYAARLLKTQLLSSQDDIDGAVASLETLRTEFPTRPEAYEILYRYYLRVGQRDRAVGLIDEGLQAAPDNSALQYFKADILLGSGKFDEALTIYGKLLETRPDDKIVANNFVSLTNELRDDDESLQKALRVSRVLEDEDNPFYLDTVGWANFRVGNYPRAIDFLTRAVAGVKDNPELLYHLGAAELAIGEAERGRTNLERALELGGAEFRFQQNIRELLK